MPIRAVTFDFWNTLMWEEPGQLRAARLGFWTAAFPQVDATALAAAHDAAHARYLEMWRAGQQFVVAHAAALMQELLDGELPATAVTTLLEGFDEGGRRAAIHPCGHVGECLMALKAAGIRIGIICDIGLTPAPVVRELLMRDGLLEHFDDAAFSDEVGYYKPAREIFEYALTGLGGVAPHEAAHVGDRQRTDIGGALAAGMTAIRYNAIYDEDIEEGPRAHLVSADLAEVPAFLGVRAQNR